MTRKNKLIVAKTDHRVNIDNALEAQAAKIIVLERDIQQLQAQNINIKRSSENPNVIQSGPKAEGVILASAVLGRDEIMITPKPCLHTCSVCLREFDSTRGTGGILSTLVNLAPYKPTVENKEHMKGYIYCCMKCHELLNASLSANRGEVNIKPMNPYAPSYPPTQMSGAIKAIIKIQDEANKLKQKDVPQLQVKNPEVTA